MFGRITRIKICSIVLKEVEGILESIMVTGQSRATLTEITILDLVTSQSEESLISASIISIF
jgi:AAA15 family ATPase/GTPase